jgi:hypothetical protein
LVLGPAARSVTAPASHREHRHVGEWRTNYGISRLPRGKRRFRQEGRARAELGVNKLAAAQAGCFGTTDPVRF